MTLDQLIAEGERLARPSLLLTDIANDDGIVACWGGQGPEGTLPGYARDAKHWITIDCGWHARQGTRVRGSLSVYQYTGRDGADHGLAIYDPAHTIDELPIWDGVKLYGEEHPSFPPLPAICLYGSWAVEEWLVSVGLSRYDYDHVFFTEVGRPYEQEWLKRSPWLANEYYAVMGGWHIKWPEDDFYMPREMNLMVWTFKDSEPWVEVWERLPNFRVCLRTT